MPIYQEKNKNKWTKDGRSWYFRCYYTDMYGNRKQKVSKLYKTKKETQLAESDFLTKIQVGDKVKYDISFKEVYDEWLLFQKNKLKSSSYYRMKQNLNKHLLSDFNNYKLSSIKTNTLLLWKENLTTRNISLDFQNKIIGKCQDFLKYAVDNYDFDTKVASKLQKHKIETVRTKLRDSEINYWTYEEFTKFIDAVDDKFYYTLFSFLYYTGLRYGEMNALTWRDVDFERKELIINKSLTVKIEGGGYAITTPKTQNSNRIIDLPDKVIKLLRDHLEHEKKLYKFNKDMFIFGNIRFIAQTTFNNNLKKYIKKAEVKSITPHGFRHSHASLLIDLGCDSRDVAERLGDTVQMVEKTYYHMFPKKKKRAVNLLNNLEK